MISMKEQNWEEKKRQKITIRLFDTNSLSENRGLFLTIKIAAAKTVFVVDKIKYYKIVNILESKLFENPAEGTTFLLFIQYYLIFFVRIISLSLQFWFLV